MIDASAELDRTGEKMKYTQTDRRTDRQTDRQTDRHCILDC